MGKVTKIVLEDVRQARPCTVVKLACPFVTVCIGVLSIAMHLVLLPFPFIAPAIRPGIFTITLHVDKRQFCVSSRQTSAWYRHQTKNGKHHFATN